MGETNDSLQEAASQAKAPRFVFRRKDDKSTKSIKIFNKCCWGVGLGLLEKLDKITKNYQTETILNFIKDEKDKSRQHEALMMDKLLNLLYRPIYDDITLSPNLLRYYFIAQFTTILFYRPIYYDITLSLNLLRYYFIAQFTTILLYRSIYYDITLSLNLLRYYFIAQFTTILLYRSIYYDITLSLNLLRYYFIAQFTTILLYRSIYYDITLSLN